VNSLRAVFVYEWKRSLTAGRIAWWFAMAAFPVLITILIRTLGDFEDHNDIAEQKSIWSVTLYALIPGVCVTLSVLLTAAPAIASELEQRSWAYLATRPNGIFWLLLGKFLVSVTWGTTAAWLGTAFSVGVCGMDEQLRMLVSLSALSLLSAIAYSAVYLLVGAVFPKRAMVFCMMYTVLVELVFGSIPAVINRITVQFRLRTLFVNWMPLDERMKDESVFQYVMAEGSSFMQCFWLIALSSLFLVAAIVVAHRKEFTSATEGDV
jgi:ABC-type transport system involved in multi-copper enzyme maturation permease subunit